MFLATMTDTTSIYYRAIALTKANDPILAQSFWETAAKNDLAVEALKQVYYQERKPQTDLEKAFYVTLSYRRSQSWDLLGNHY